MLSALTFGVGITGRIGYRLTMLVSSGRLSSYGGLERITAWYVIHPYDCCCITQSHGLRSDQASHDQAFREIAYPWFETTAYGTGACHNCSLSPDMHPYPGRVRAGQTAALTSRQVSSIVAANVR